MPSIDELEAYAHENKVIINKKIKAIDNAYIVCNNINTLRQHIRIVIVLSKRDLFAHCCG